MCSRNAHHLVVFLPLSSEFALLPTSNSSNPSGARRGYCVNRACGLTDQTDRVVGSNRVRTQNSIYHNSVRSSPRNLCLSSSFVMAQQSKEPCKKEACDIQACLTKNNFDSKRCLKVIELLQSCCEKCSYKSTHCASVAGLLKNSSK